MADGHPQVLLAAGATATVSKLCDSLKDRGIETDVVHTLGEAREAFLASGGHGLVLLGPDLTPSAARQVASSLTEIDPDLTVCVFGDDLLRDDGKARRIGHHPSSRAALGAVLKALQSL